MRFKFPGVALIIGVCVISCSSCESSKRSLFGEKKSPHEKYADNLRQAGLDKSEMGRRWLSASVNGLLQPARINLPYKETGYFAADKPAAAGFRFPARRGDLLLITVSANPVQSPLFVELWNPGEAAGDEELLAVADSTFNIRHEIERDGDHLLRLQPELLSAIEYTVTITTAPALSFPVSDSGKPSIVSFWKDRRDNGARTHEGIDIAAKFRTEAVAAADGFISRVTDNRLGGKVIFMRPEGRDYALYYAHLDTQMVSNGQQVTKGQVIGLIGNTGNARNTIPHLHFGIYARGGAVDPLPFIDPKRKQPDKVTASTDHLNKWVRTQRPTKVYSSPSREARTLYDMSKDEVFQVTSATGKWYRIITADTSQGFISSDVVTDKPLTLHTSDTITRLLDGPNINAASIQFISQGERLHIKGAYQDFYLVQVNNQTGWILKQNL